MHGNLLNKNKSKMFLTANSDLAARISILENNVYKVTYYEIISGASGTLTVPTGATINSGEFSGANCVLSEIDGSNKPTFVTPLDGGGTPVTSTLNVGTGAWVKSGVTVSVNVALIYSVDITAADYQNLNNFYIIDNVLISSLSQVLTNSGTASTLSSELSRVISDETGSGALVFGTSPTFVTDITTPLVIGGTAVGSRITYKSTTGVGTSTGAAHIFTGGTNGGTTIATLYNSGQTSFGNYATPSAQRLVTIGQDTAYMSFGSYTANTTQIAFYANQATPDSTNYSIRLDAVGNTYINAFSRTSAIILQAANTDTLLLLRGRQTSGVNITTEFQIPANTGQTASTEIPNFKVTGNTKTWANGGGATTITNQRWNYLTANTAATSGGGSLTITNSYGAYFEAATASGVTITNNWALGTNGGIFLNGTANTVLGNAALATNATTGFLHVPGCAGTPTGVPTLYTGMIPICADSTNNKLYIYSGGAWVALN